MLRGSPPLTCVVTDFLLARKGLRRGALRRFGAAQEHLRKGIQWHSFSGVVCSLFPPRRVGLGKKRSRFFVLGEMGVLNRKRRYMTPSSQAFISMLKNLSQSHVFVQIGRKDLQHPLG